MENGRLPENLSGKNKIRQENYTKKLRKNRQTAYGFYKNNVLYSIMACSLLTRTDLSAGGRKQPCIAGHQKGTGG